MTKKPESKKPKRTHPWRGFNYRSLREPTQEGAENRVVPPRSNPLRRSR